jgi:hypothetical protein
MDLVSDVAGISDAIERARAASGRIDDLLHAVDQLSDLRAEGIRKMADAGMKHAQIARALGLTPARISQLLKPNAPIGRAFLGGGKDPITVAIGGKLEVGRSDGDEQAMLSAGSMDAFQIISDLATTVGRSASCEVVPPPGDVDLNRPNLIVLTSPRLLPFLKQVLGADPAYGFGCDDQGWHLINRETGDTYRSPRDVGEATDYAYLGRLVRPDGRGSFLYLAGIHAQGTVGAAQYLADSLAELHRTVKQRRFSVLLSCQYDPTSREIKNVEPLAPLRIHEGP